MYRNNNLHSQDGSGFGRDKFAILKKGAENFWIIIMTNMLIMHDVYRFATRDEQFPGEDEPDPNDPEFVNDPDRLEKAQDAFAALVEKLSATVKKCIGYIVESLARSPGYLDKATRIVTSDHEWTIAEVWDFVKTGFVARTRKQIEKARDNYEKCYQAKFERIEIYGNRLVTFKNTYETIAAVVVDPYDFLVRFLENVNNYFRSYGLIYLNEIKSIHRHNEQEQDPANHQPYPVFHTILQELEGFEADNRTDEHLENNTHRKKDKKKTKHKEESKNDQVMVVSKLEFEKFNKWKTNQAINNNTDGNVQNKSANNSKGKKGVCFDFQNTGACHRDNCPYLHIPRKPQSQHKSPAHNGSGGRGGRGGRGTNGGRHHGGRGFVNRHAMCDNFHDDYDDMQTTQQYSHNVSSPEDLDWDSSSSRSRSRSGTRIVKPQRFDTVGMARGGRGFVAAESNRVNTILGSDSYSSLSSPHSHSTVW
jgi:Zn/Cd-binding protein ZinT